jgi:hypothetical protein
MPYMQAYVENANIALNRYNIQKFQANALMPGVAAPSTILSASVSSLPNVALTDEAKTYLDSWPLGLQETVRAAVYSAVMRQLPVTFAWMPAYDFKVTVTETAGTAASLGGMTILLESPLPPKPA